MGIARVQRRVRNIHCRQASLKSQRWEPEADTGNRCDWWAFRGLVGTEGSVRMSISWWKIRFQSQPWATLIYRDLGMQDLALSQTARRT